MVDGDTLLIRSSEGERLGITEGRNGEIVISNRLIAALTGNSLVQFRMGYGIHLEFGDDCEVTIETQFEVVDGDTRWSGEPLTAEAAAALLPLNLRDVTSAVIGTDDTLVLGLGTATVNVAPHLMYEAWQVRGPDGLLIVCSPGGDYVAVWKAEIQG